MSVARTLTVVAAAFAAALLSALPAAARPNPHAALECTYCHLDTPTFGVDTRATVNYWRAAGDEPALCERCHADDQNLHPLGVVPGEKCLDTVCPVSLPLGTSEAVKGQVVCTTCHFLHAANADFALLRGFPGSDRPRLFTSWQELCRQCHGANLEKRSPHAGDDRACGFCHAAKPVAGQPVTVTPVGRKLCDFCHGPMGAEHFAGVNPFKEPQECTGCHDPHLGKDHPARLKAGYFEPIKDLVTLNPHGRRTLCFACHPDGPAGKKLREADPVALCQRCHGSGEIPGMSHPMTAVPAGYAIPQGWPLAGGKMTCLTCHRPGHLEDDRSAPHLLRGAVAGDRTAVCFACHKREQWAGRNPHREVAEKREGCEACHVGKPIWGKNEPQVIAFRADVNIVCLACHNPTAHPGGVAHTMTLTAAMLPPDPELPLGRGNRITCATCHNPHMDRKDGHNLRGPKDPVPFCARCHRELTER